MGKAPCFGERQILKCVWCFYLKHVFKIKTSWETVFLFFFQVGKASCFGGRRIVEDVFIYFLL